MKIFLLSKLLKKRNNFVFETLKNNPIFKNLSSFELKIIAKLVYIRNYKAGEQLFKQGQPAMGMYMIVKGNVQILNEDIYFNPKMDKEEKKKKNLKELQNGDFLGELTLVEETAFRDYSAQAVVDTVLIGFFKPALLELMDTRPVISTKILYNLSQSLAKELSRLIS